MIPFSLSDKLNRTKNKLLIVSGISLFVSLSKGELTTQVTVMGLNLLQSDSNMVGVFLWVINLYLFLVFSVFAGMEIIKYRALPKIISYQQSKVTGEILGLNSAEAFPDDDVDTIDDDYGTPRGEQKSIMKQQSEIPQKVSKCYHNTLNSLTMLFECIVPIVFGAISLRCLYLFLISRIALGNCN